MEDPSGWKGEQLLKAKPINKRQTQDKRKAKAIELLAKEIPVADVVRVTGIPYNTVKAIKLKFLPIFKKINDVQNYRNLKADILAAGQVAALESAMSPSKLAKASFVSTLQGFKILNEAERLENNQSTSNIAHVFSQASSTSGLPDE